MYLVKEKKEDGEYCNTMKHKRYWIKDLQTACESRNETMLKEDAYYQYTNDEKGLGLYEIIVDEYGEMICRGNDFIPLTNEQITSLNET